MNEDEVWNAVKNTLSDVQMDHPVEAIEERGRTLRGRRRLAWQVAGGGSFAVAAIAAVAVATSGSGVQAPATPLAAPSAATSSTTQDSPLVQLVSYLSTAKAPTGDATLLLRDQVFKNGSKIDVWDLHADNGDYYFAKTRGALPARVTGKHVEQDKSERKNAVAAAAYAAKGGDLNEARERMALADLPANPKVTPTLLAPGVSPPESDSAKAKLKATKGKYHAYNQTDNWVWNNSVTALTVGAGNPAVRAGVLRLLGQIPEIKVSKGTLGDQAVLILTAGSLATTDGTETLTVNAENGLPIKFTVTGMTINYTVTRVTIANVAKGKF